MFKSLVIHYYLFGYMICFFLLLYINMCRYDQRVRDLLDFSIYLDISDDVKFAWKIQVYCHSSSYSCILVFVLFIIDLLKCRGTWQREDTALKVLKLVLRLESQILMLISVNIIQFLYLFSYLVLVGSKVVKFLQLKSNCLSSM